MLIEVAAALVVSGFLLLIIGIFIARQYTLRAKLVTAFLVIVLISLAVLAVLDSYIMSKNLTDSANNVLSSTARHYAERIDRFNQQNIRFLETEADMPAIKSFIKLKADPPFERQTLLEILRALKSRQDETIQSYAILDRHGINILDTVQENTGIDESRHDYFKMPVRKSSSGNFRSPVFFDQGKPYIVFSSAINDLSGKVIGVLRAKYDASILFSLIDRTKNMVGRGSFVILLDENQQRLVHGRRSSLNFTLSRHLEQKTIKSLINEKRLLPGTSNRHVEKPEWLDRIMAASVSNPIIETQFYGLGTVVFSAAVVNLESAPWTIIVSLPQEVFLEPVSAQTESAFLLVAAIILVVFLIVMAATQLLLGPVKRLTGVVRKISGGDLKAKAKVEADDEIGGLADAFNEMTHNINQLMEQRLQHEKELWRQANYDQLTGLPNRTRVNRLIEKEIEVASKENKKIAFLYMDFDHFKHINDTLGHESGDEFLKYMSGRLQACVRNTDTVARLGGDEFLIMLIETTDDDQAEAPASERIAFEDIVKSKADEILSSVSQPSVIDDMEFSVTASIGIAIYPQDGDLPYKLLKNADTAMYRSKRKGRNMYQMFTPEMGDKVLLRVEIDKKLRHALINGDFYLKYQALLDTRTKKVVGAEALLRWEDKDFGDIEPELFIPLAEESGLIVDIGDWVLNTALADVKSWREDKGYEDYYVAINLSSRQFRGKDIVKKISGFLEQHELPGSSLELEITERLLMKDVPHVAGILNQFKEMGLRLSIDDFGTGYSSLSYLRRFPFDVLKIDKAFISDIGGEQSDTSLCDAIISMAHSLKLDIIGEGVETLEQFEFLEQRGVETLQGFYISKPMVNTEFVGFIKDPVWPADKS